MSITVTSFAPDEQSAHIARTRQSFNAHFGHGRALGVLCRVSNFPTSSVRSTSRSLMNRHYILHAACSLITLGFALRRSRMRLLSRSCSARSRTTTATTMATPAARRASKPKPLREPPRESPLSPFDFFYESLRPRALAFREPRCGRTPFRAPGMFGGIELWREKSSLKNSLSFQFLKDSNPSSDRQPPWPVRPRTCRFHR